MYKDKLSKLVNFPNVVDKYTNASSPKFAKLKLKIFQKTYFVRKINYLSFSNFSNAKISDLIL